MHFFLSCLELSMLIFDPYLAIVFFFFVSYSGGGGRIWGLPPVAPPKKHFFFICFFGGKMVLFYLRVWIKKLQLQIIVKRNSTKLENLNSDISINLWKNLLGKRIVTSHSHVITKHKFNCNKKKRVKSNKCKKKKVNRKKKKLKKIINFLVFFFFSLLHHGFLFLISYVYLMNSLVKVGALGKKSFFFAQILRFIQKNNFLLKRSNLVVSLKDAFGEGYLIWTNYKLLIMPKMLFLVEKWMTPFLPLPPENLLPPPRCPPPPKKINTIIASPSLYVWKQKQNCDMQFVCFHSLHKTFSNIW